jgi:dolichyl-phosphate beta-glucosyltransferase
MWEQVFNLLGLYGQVGNLSPQGKAMQPEMSLVMPAYNEARRLPAHLEQVRAYLGAEFGDRYEVLVIDDGSGDGLGEVLERSQTAWTQLRVERLPQNRGKGAALRVGMRAARGALVLFADADGATPIAEETRLRAAMSQGADVAVGSRLTPGRDVKRERPVVRALAGRLFAGCVRALTGVGVADSQCGFKMFRQAAAQRLFGLAREDGYLIDVEVLLWARRLGFVVAEVPVSWREAPGSKLRLCRDGPRMLGGLVRLRRAFRAAPAGTAERIGEPLAGMSRLR